MSLPHLTVDLPGTGGAIRVEPADFTVVEILSYEPSGAGDHTYVLIEKRGLNTQEAATRIARAVGISPGAVGYAGLKDRHAVTVQTFSVERVAPETVRTAVDALEGMRVLAVDQHRNKLRLGHLRGNRFRIRVRGVVEDAEALARPILLQLEERGVPNWFGEQRFGNRGDNHEVGRLLVQGDVEGAVRQMLGRALADDPESVLGCAYRLFAEGDPRAAADSLPAGFRSEARLFDVIAHRGSEQHAFRTLPKRLTRLLVSAYQSHLFNQQVAARLPALGTLERGDLAFLHDRRAVFCVEDLATEQPRADAFELSPSGALFGLGVKLAQGAPGEREHALLAAEGLTPKAFKVRGVGRFDGERRPLRVPLEDVDVTTVPTAPDEPRAIEVAFRLPRGSYATAVLAEVMKTTG